jgi:hypothetical protein
MIAIAPRRFTAIKVYQVEVSPAIDYPTSLGKWIPNFILENFNTYQSLLLGNLN